MKGYTPPDNRLAEELAKYFEERTEIEYNILIDKMKSVSEADIMHLLGIKPKAEDTKDKGSNNSEAGKTVDELSPEEQKEADDFLESFKEDTKSKLEKEKENDSESEKSVQELLPQDQKVADEPKETEKKIEMHGKTEQKKQIAKQKKGKGLSQVQPCSVKMGNKVPNKSPVKVIHDTDSDVFVISSDSNEPVKGNEKPKTECESPLNLSIKKKEETDVSENEGSSSHRVYFSDSNEFKKAVMSQQRKQDDEQSENSSVASGGIYIGDSDDFNLLKSMVNQNKQEENVTDGSLSMANSREVDQNKENDTDARSTTDGVVFSDSSDFNRIKKIADASEKKSEENGNENDLTSSTDGFYFSDIEEFKKAKARAGQLSNNDSTYPLFEKDTESVDSDDAKNVSIAKINLKKAIQLQEKEEQKCKEKTDETQG